MTTATVPSAAAQRLRRPERIVLAVGTAGDVAVVAWTADRSRHHRTAVRVVTAVDAAEPAAGRDGRRLLAGRAVLRAREELRGLAPGSDVSTAVVDGDEVEVVLGEARTAQLVVLAASPDAGWAQSTTMLRLASRLPCPLVLVPSGWRPRTGAVLALAGPTGTPAVDLAVAEAERAAQPVLLAPASQLPIALGLPSAPGGPVTERDAVFALAGTVAAARPSLHVEALPGPAVLRAAMESAALVVVDRDRMIDWARTETAARAAVVMESVRRPLAIVPVPPRPPARHRGGA